MQTPQRSSVTKQAYNIGDVLPDGWVVGPVCDGVIIAIEPVSGALDDYQTWYQGEDHAKKLRGEGHETARQPSDSELNAIYNDIVKAGRNGNAKLNTSGSFPYGKYWSSATCPGNPDFARVEYVGGGNRRDVEYKIDASARVRCVRDEPGLTLA